MSALPRSAKYKAAIADTKRIGDELVRACHIAVCHASTLLSLICGSLLITYRAKERDTPLPLLNSSSAPFHVFGIALYKTTAD